MCKRHTVAPPAQQMAGKSRTDVRNVASVKLSENRLYSGRFHGPDEPAFGGIPAKGCYSHRRARNCGAEDVDAGRGAISAVSARPGATLCGQQPSAWQSAQPVLKKQTQLRSTRWH